MAISTRDTIIITINEAKLLLEAAGRPVGTAATFALLNAIREKGDDVADAVDSLYDVVRSMDNEQD